MQCVVVSSNLLHVYHFWSDTSDLNIRPLSYNTLLSGSTNGWPPSSSLHEIEPRTVAACEDCELRSL